MLCNSRFDAFVRSDINKADYMFVDPPWNYRPSQYAAAELWSNVTFTELFRYLKCNTIFMWLTVEQLPVMISGYAESSFELKACVPYWRVARNEDVMFGLKQGARNPLMFLAVLQTKTSPITTLLQKALIVEEDNEFKRPVVWEDSMFRQLNAEGFRGLYILPNGGVADIVVDDPAIGNEMVRKELF